jgi:transposase
MSKYSRSLKTTVARRYLAGGFSGQLSQEFNIPANQICYWGAVYTFNQESSFLPPKPTYRAKDKLKILTKMQAERWSSVHTSAFFNLSSLSTLSVWLHNFEVSGIEGLNLRSVEPLWKNVPYQT